MLFEKLWKLEERYLWFPAGIRKKQVSVTSIQYLLYYNAVLLAACSSSEAGFGIFRLLRKLLCQTWSIKTVVTKCFFSVHRESILNMHHCAVLTARNVNIRTNKSKQEHPVSLSAELSFRFNCLAFSTDFSPIFSRVFLKVLAMNTVQKAFSHPELSSLTMW